MPDADEAMARLVERWAAQNKVEVQADFFSPTTTQPIITWAAEAQARTGHDVMQGGSGLVTTYADLLTSPDELVARLQAQYGPVDPAAAQVANIEGRWVAVPTYKGSNLYPCLGRIDLFNRHVGLDLHGTFPATNGMGPGYDDWTWDAFLLAAERCHHAGVPFGLPISVCDDAIGWLSPVFLAFGAALVDAKGRTTLDSDATRAALDYIRRLAAFLPDSVYSWDNASNNRAMAAGGTALIVNPPSAWAQAIKDAPQVGSQCWHFPMPAGPEGRFANGNMHFWGIWSFSRNQSAAGDLIEWLSQRPQAEQICTADSGFDLPPFVSMTDFNVWTDAGPPVGTLSNYPVKPGHHATLTPTLYPAPRALALAINNAGILPNLVARVTKGGESADAAIAWARAELDGIRR